MTPIAQAPIFAALRDRTALLAISVPTKAFSRRQQPWKTMTTTTTFTADAPGAYCVFCAELIASGYRLYARTGLDSGVQFRRVGAGAIGDQSLLASGFLDAIDVYGWAEQGVGVCFPGAGSLLFLDAAFSPRAPVPLSGYRQDGMTCADIDRPGTLLLLSGAPPAAGRFARLVAPASSSRIE